VTIFLQNINPLASIIKLWSFL